MGPKARMRATRAAPVAIVFAKQREGHVARRQTLSHDPRTYNGGEQKESAGELRYYAAME
jgi:hypothetical protein